MDIAPGALIGQKYRLDRPFARGGMGAVWLARHVQLGSTVAIKFLDPAFAISAVHRQRFEREARAAATLKSPHVVHVQDYGFEEDTPYLVMELLEGEDLDQRLERVGRLSLEDTARILVQVGKALRKAHEAGIVHRDLKPANLFLARVEDDEVVKILDFGIAKETATAVAGDATRTGEVIGSPHYMSPEQIRAERTIDPRTDLWSLGVILFRVVTGSLPFPGDLLGPVLASILTDPLPPASQLAPGLPRDLDAFFARALARDRAHRFQTVQELIETFYTAAGGRNAFPSISISLGRGTSPSLPIVGHGLATNPMMNSGPLTGNAPIARDKPTSAGGAASANGPAIAGTSGGLAHTGSRPMPGRTGLIVGGVLLALAATAVGAFLLLRRPAPPPPIAASTPTVTGVIAAPSPEPQAPIPPSVAVSPAPPPIVSALAVASAPPVASTEVSTSAPAASAPKRPLPAISPTSRPAVKSGADREKWF